MFRSSRLLPVLVGVALTAAAVVACTPAPSAAPPVTGSGPAESVAGGTGPGATGESSSGSATSRQSSAALQVSVADGATGV